MPGTLESFEVIVFDESEGEVSRGTTLLNVSTADEARDLAKRLASTHAGTLALCRSGNTAVGEVNVATVLQQHGRIGDFG